MRKHSSEDFSKYINDEPKKSIDVKEPAVCLTQSTQVDSNESNVLGSAFNSSPPEKLKDLSLRKPSMSK